MLKITNRQQIEDIVGFINYKYGYTDDESKIDASQVKYISEEGRDLGFCETCSMWEDGIQLHFENKRPNSFDWFSDIEMDRVLDWVHDNKPEDIYSVPKEHRHLILNVMQKYGITPAWPRNDENQFDIFFDIYESDVNWDDINIEVDTYDKSVHIYFSVIEDSRFVYDDATDQELLFTVDETYIKDLYQPLRDLNWFRDQS